MLANGSNTSDLVARITAAFAEQIGPARYLLWFPPNARLDERPGEIVVACRSEQFRDWARDQFGDDLQQAVNDCRGDQTLIRFTVEPARFSEAEAELIEGATKPKRVATNLFGERDEPPAKPRREDAPPTRKWKTIKDFVTGPGNRVAAAAAQGVIDEPGLGPNPLILFGPVGTGKTHLLEAIVAGLKPRTPKPLFLTAEEFTHRFVKASRSHRTGSFRKLTRAPGGLLLDDLGFLANKKATQEELLHILDDHLAEGRPVVFTLDTHPRFAEDLLPELVDRLLGGAAWGLLPPDDETRYAILRAKATPPLAEDVLRYLARRLNGNVRELEGALHSLRHFAKVTGEPITLPVAKDILAELLRHSVRTITLSDVDTATCKALRLPSGSLQSKERTFAVTQPRMLAVYLARKHTSATYGEIAKHFGVKQHSTALAAEKKVRTLLSADGLLHDAPAADTLARIERELFR